MTYYGITIGPVVDTLQLSSKPLGLWLGSYLFSEFSRRICTELQDIGVSETEFFSPAYTAVARPTAIGTYHDRVIFQSEVLSKTDIVEAIQKAIAQLQNSIDDAVPLNDYLVYHVATLERSQGNIIREFAPILDSLEYNQQLIPGHVIQDMRDLLGNNDRLKKLSIFTANKASLLNESHLLKDGEKIRDIRELTNKQGYYAILQADGDGVGKLLSSLQNGELRQFSTKLSSFADKVAKKLEQVGGSLIYAGGDDLLAIAPANPKGTDWLTFAREIDGLLKETLENKDVSLSLSVNIFYHKYPLYEALATAAYQLFAVAKSERVGKGAVVFHIEKHSGQLIDFIVKYRWAGSLYEILLSNIEKEAAEQNNSIMYHFMRNQQLFALAIADYYQTGGDMLDNVVENYFKHTSQQEGASKENRDLSMQILKGLKVVDGLSHIRREEGHSDAETALEYLTQIMRYRKFILEIGGDSHVAV